MSTTIKTTSRKVRLGVKCGDCLHYTRAAKFEDVCCKLGISKRNNAPDCFHPDYYKLNSCKEPEKTKEVAKVVGSLRPSQLRVLAYTLTKNANHLKPLGFSFGQTVYFSLGRDYLSHYFKGYIIGFNTETKHIILSARLNKDDHSTVAQFLPSSLYSRTEFKKIRKDLIKRNRVIMPNEDKKYLSKLPVGELIKKDGSLPPFEKMDFNINYEPPTLDSAPPEWLEKESKRKKKKRSRTSSLRFAEDLKDVSRNKKHFKRLGLTHIG